MYLKFPEILCWRSSNNQQYRFYRFGPQFNQPIPSYMANFIFALKLIILIDKLVHFLYSKVSVWLFLHRTTKCEFYMAIILRLKVCKKNL